MCAWSPTRTSSPTLQDTNNPEYSIAAQTGSIQYNLAEEHSPEANIVSLAKVTDIVAELVAGKIDGAYIETLPAMSYQVNYPRAVPGAGGPL